MTKPDKNTTSPQWCTEGHKWLDKYAEELFKYNPKIGNILWFKGVQLIYTKDGWVEDSDNGGK